MDINDLFENIANIFNQFADEILAEQAHKNKPITGRGPESKRIRTDRELRTGVRQS